jgi:hypothetical protein
MAASCGCCESLFWQHWYICIPELKQYQRSVEHCEPTDILPVQAFHIALRLLLFRASVTKWTLFGFALSALVELVCYTALAQIAGEHGDKLVLNGRSRNA